MPRHAVRPFLPLLLVVLALFAGQVWVFRWGVVTPDTVFQWGQARSGQYDDWHPPVTAWLWRQLMRLAPGGVPATAPVLLFDCALYWAGVLLIADGLRRRGHALAMAAAVIVAASPIPFGQMGAILKDPLLAACCLAAAGLILARERRPLPATLAAAALLVLASATRFNAVAATAPLLAAFAPAGWTRGVPRALATTLGAAALLAGAAWLIDDMALRPHHARPIFSQLNFDLGGIVAHGGAGAYPNLDAGEERRLTALCYTPALYNPRDSDDCGEVEERLKRHAEARGIGPARIWLAAVARHPIAYARHRIAHLAHNWRVYGTPAPNDAAYVMTTPNPYGIGFHATAAAGAVSRAAWAMARSPLGRPVTWLIVAAVLLALRRHVRNPAFVVPVAASALLYGLGYAVASVAPDLRYNLWTMLGAAMALVAALARGRGPARIRRRG